MEVRIVGHQLIGGGTSLHVEYEIEVMLISGNSSIPDKEFEEERSEVLHWIVLRRYAEVIRII
jgi:hypothetical protein